MLCFTISGLLQYSGPLLIQHIIAYITEDERDLQKGIILVLSVIFSRLFIAIFASRAQVLLVKTLILEILYELFKKRLNWV